MGWTPRLTLVCGRCGKPRGLAHVCVTSRPRKGASRVEWRFPPCPRCKKEVRNPLTHICRSKRGDFGRRRKKFEQQQKAAARAARPQHDYHTCTDQECRRPVCVAYREGDERGFNRGYEAGWYARDARGDPA
jgi:hypothetical protein